MPLPVITDAEFAGHSDCTGCELHRGARCVGMSMRRWDGDNRGCDKAVIIIGKAPAVEEDAACKSFVGVTGMYTNELYVRGSGIDEFADVFLANAARCRLPNPKMTVGPGMLKACLPHLLQDLDLLRSRYSEVVILATGADALKLVMGKGISLISFEQGCKVKLGGHEYRVFSTYLAAALLPGRDPSKAVVVESHLELLCEYLSTGKITMEVKIDQVDRESRIPPDAAIVALDIETYGYFEGYPRQWFFHPRKMIHWDKIAPEDIVVMAAAAWRDPTDGSLRHRFWDLTNGWDSRDMVQDLLGLKKPVILGMNLPFDVMCLRTWHPVLREWFKPFGKVRLVELGVLNFLDCDQRPERSLKNISMMLRTYNYGQEEISIKKGQRFPSVDDPRAAHYNVVDAVATLRNMEILQAHTKRKFGENTPKGGERCLRWYSDLLWLAIEMSENGIKYDRPKLERIHKRLSAKIERVKTLASRKFGAILGGKGTGKYVTDLTLRAVRTLGLAGDNRLKFTTVEHEVSSGQENVNLFLGLAPTGSAIRTELRCLRRVRELSKTVTSYTRPMLGIHRPKVTEKTLAKDLNNAMIDGFVYPSWYVVPSHNSGGGSEESGGTQQARITSKGPAVQTQPPEIEACQCSRYPGGALVRIDESQIELRVAAMFSHDSKMIEDYEQLGTVKWKRDPSGRILGVKTVGGGNRHASTASLVAGTRVQTKDDNPKMYHAGKTLNFLTLFLGGAHKFAETVQREAGLILSKSRAEEIIKAFDTRHAEFRVWQRGLIDFAKTHGYGEVPVLGISRTFLGTPAVIDATYVPTIANLPIQATAALLTLSAQAAIQRDQLTLGFGKVRVVGNTYDEGIYDCPPDWVNMFAIRARDYFMRPPIYSEFVAAGLYPLPLDCEVSVTYYSMAGESA